MPPLGWDDPDVPRLRAAADVARKMASGHVWIDHAELVDADVGWLGDVSRLTLWAVRHPPGFLAGLSNLEFLDLRGGSASTLDCINHCERLRVLVVNQVRGMTDLSAITQLEHLQFLSLYGLPKVVTLPSTERLPALTRVELGLMKGLTSLEPILRAPALRELNLVRTVKLNADDIAAIKDHPSLRAFGWFAEDVPDKTWVPVVEAINKPQPPLLRPEEWLDQA